MKIAIAAMLVVAACGGGSSPVTASRTPAPARAPIVRTVAHPAARRTYAIDHDAALAADVLNRRFASSNLDAAARVEGTKVVVDLGALTGDQMETAEELAHRIGRFELRREIQGREVAAYSRIQLHVRDDAHAKDLGIFNDGSFLEALDMRELSYDDAQRLGCYVPPDARPSWRVTCPRTGRELLAAYLAALPADLQLPQDHAFAYEPFTSESGYTADKGWRLHELGEPLVDEGARVDVRTAPRGERPVLRLELDPAHSQQIDARVEDRPETIVTFVLDDEILGRWAPGDRGPMEIEIDDDAQRAETAAILASGQLPAPMAYLTVEKVGTP